MEPTTVLKMAKKKGLDGVAVTDHDTIRGGLEALKVNSDPNFAVIVGSEVETTDKVDIIGLFLTREIQSRETNEVIEEIKAKRVVIDSVNLFAMLFSDDSERRNAVASLIAMLEDAKCTTIQLSSSLFPKSPSAIGRAYLSAR